MHFIDRERRDEVNPFIAAEEFFRGFAHIGAEVHRIDKVRVRISLRQARDGAADVLHGLAIVFAAVRRDKHHAAALKIQCLQRRVAELEPFLDRQADRVHDRVAADEHAVRDAFGREVVPVAHRRGKVQAGDLADQLAVHLLRERRILVKGPEAGLDVTDPGILW